MPQLHSATLYTVWFIRMKKPCIAETFSEDDHSHAIVAGQSYIIGNFPEKLRSNSEGHYFKVDYKTSYFTMKVLCIPLHRKGIFFIKNSEYFEIINFVGHTKMTSLSSL